MSFTWLRMFSSSLRLIIIKRALSVATLLPLSPVRGSLFLPAVLYPQWLMWIQSEVQTSKETVKSFSLLTLWTPWASEARTLCCPAAYIFKVGIRSDAISNSGIISWVMLDPWRSHAYLNVIFPSMLTFCASKSQKQRVKPLTQPESPKPQVWVQGPQSSCVHRCDWLLLPITVWFSFFAIAQQS